MHVTPSELRSLRQDGVVIRFALLDSMAFLVAEIPPAGSAGTLLEQSCVNPHWGFVIEGDVEFVLDDRRQTIPPGSAFHVRAGVPHRFETRGAARVAGFEPIDPVTDTSESAIAAQGFELLDPETIGAATVVPAVAAPLIEPKAIEARTWSMSSLALTQARFGPGSGYAASWCDAPHWGLVTAGSLAIEWEDDIEILAAGDVYRCPGGPPGHRLEAANPAAIIDLTPADALSGGRRLATWRRRPFQAAIRAGTGDAIAVAGLG